MIYYSTRIIWACGGRNSWNL